MRLLGVTTLTYEYKGDGDRVEQFVDGVRTEYVLDTASPLTRVLAETTGTDTIYYLHGLDLVAQSDGTSTEYFVNDGLGSVRQLVDPVGEVLLAQTYDPYGSLYASAGMDSTAFGYAGEQEDANGLIYLRARYYSPQQGRFLNMDPSRQEMNPYQYTSSNPVNYVDPSGLIEEGEAKDAYDLIQAIDSTYNATIKIDFGWNLNYGHGGNYLLQYNPSLGLGLDTACSGWAEGNWEIDRLKQLEAAIEMIASSFAVENGYPSDLSKGQELFRKAMGMSHITPAPGRDNGLAIFNWVWLPTLTGDEHFRYTVIHEYGHVWDFREGFFKHSSSLKSRVRNLDCDGMGGCYYIGFVSDDEDPLIFTSYDKVTSSALEDWAESFAAFIDPKNTMFLGDLTPIRKAYVREAIQGLSVPCQHLMDKKWYKIMECFSRQMS